MKLNKKEIFIFIVLIIIFSMSIAPKTFQNDTFFTIAVGEKILEQGIYTDETFTWHQGLKYENVRWLFDILITKIYQISGFFGIYLFVMIMTAIIGITLFNIFLKKDIKPIGAFLLAIITIYFGRAMFCARAQIISFWLFILEAYFIEQLLKTGKKRYSAFLFIIGVLIANFHASVYPLFFVLFIPYIAELILAKLPLNQTDESKIIIEKRNNIKNMFFTLIICAFSGLCTPIGFMPYLDMFKTIGAISSDIIGEMLPLNLLNSLNFMSIVVLVIGILVFSKTKIRIVDAFFLLGFILLSLSNNRSLFFFIFIGMSSVANILKDFFYEYKVEWNLSPKVKKIGIVFLSIIIIFISGNNFSKKINADYVDVGEYPVDAAKYIMRNLNIQDIKLYNGFNIGSYLEFCKIPVFMDSRAEIYIEQFNDTTILKDFQSLSSGGAHYNEIFEKYGITHALLYTNEIVSIYIKEDSNWQCIYQDDSFVLYEKIQ